MKIEDALPCTCRDNETGYVGVWRNGVQIAAHDETCSQMRATVEKLLAEKDARIEAAEARNEKLAAALEQAREFIAAEYQDPSAAPDGEWLALEARPVHAAICAALQEAAPRWRRAMKDDGGPAFPLQPLGPEGLPVDSAYPGMSLRDWFAGQALGAKTLGNLIGYEDAPGHRAVLIRRLARDCYEIADALLSERDR